MAMKFNADEILGIAIRIEQNGAVFYRRAAQIATNKGNVEYLHSLADMEDNHALVFEKMRASLKANEKEPTTYDPDDETALYLAATADTHRGEGSSFAASGLTGKESITDILTTAIELEKRSILFYLGIKNMVPETLGRDRIDRIIDQEMGHVATLTRELKKVKG